MHGFLDKMSSASSAGWDFYFGGKYNKEQYKKKSV